MIAACKSGRRKGGCPLSPALVLLLQASLDARTTHDRPLACRLCLSPETVRTEFKRVGRVLGTHDRFASVLTAWERGWIVLRFAPPPTESKTTKLP